VSGVAGARPNNQLNHAARNLRLTSYGSQLAPYIMRLASCDLSLCVPWRKSLYGILRDFTGFYGILRENAIGPAIALQSIYGKMQHNVVIMQYRAIVYGIYGFFFSVKTFLRNLKILAGLRQRIFMVYGIYGKL
jgi:hypothetical protein